MRQSCLALALLVCLVSLAAAQSADWPQWRGPDRNGVVPGGPALADSWAATGPVKVWQSEILPNIGPGGYGCPVVADGKVFIYVTWDYWVPIENRTLTPDAVRRLGWLPKWPAEGLLKSIEDARSSDELAALKGKDAENWAKKWHDANITNPRPLSAQALLKLGYPPDKPSEKLAKAVEDARMSDELAKLKGKELQDWVKKWVDTNLTDEKEKKDFGAWAAQRVAEGKNAIATNVLEQLASIKDKVFATQGELGKWFGDNIKEKPVRDAAWGRVAPLVQPDDRVPFAGWAWQRLMEGKGAPALDLLETMATSLTPMTADALLKLGYPPATPPEKLAKAVEETRTSDELAKLKGKEWQDWVKKWMEANLADAKEKQQFAGWVTQRLTEGKKGIPSDVLEKIASIKDKAFATQAELDKWLKDNGIADPIFDRVIPFLRVAKNKEFATQADLDKWLDELGIKDPLRKRVLSVIPVQKQMAYDSIVCLNAADGKKLWKSDLPGQPRGQGSSSTACVVNGRCYVIGSDSDAYCLDVKDGSKMWSVKVTKGGGERNCSFIVVDGAAIIPAGPLTALDAEKGTELWKQDKIGNVNSSPAVWEKDGKKVLIINAGGQVFGVDAKTGAIAWNVPGPGGMSTPVCSGDYMVLVGDNKNVGLIAYKMSSGAKAEKAWNVPACFDPASSAIIDQGVVYAVNGNTGNMVRVELETGKVVWDKKVGVTYYSSPVLADGKLFAEGGPNGREILMMKPTVEDCVVVGKGNVNMGVCTTPAIADGKLYIHLVNCIACYDLTKKAEPPPPPPVVPPAKP